MSETKTLYAWKWIDGYGANRPMMPSEARTTVSGTKRYLPWAQISNYTFDSVTNAVLAQNHFGRQKFRQTCADRF